MRAFVIAVLAGCLLPLTAAAEDFHIDTLAPGEAAAAYCRAVYWHRGEPPSETDDPPHIFETDNNARVSFIKIDGAIHVLDRVDDEAGDAKLYRDAEVTVKPGVRVYRVDETDGHEADAYHLRGALVVTVSGSSQSVSVEGLSICFQGAR